MFHTTRSVTGITSKRTRPLDQTIYGYEAPQADDAMPRDVQKWLQSLNLTVTIKNPRRDFANGYLAAQIFERYYPVRQGLCRRQRFSTQLRPMPCCTCCRAVPACRDGCLRSLPAAEHGLSALSASSSMPLPVSGERHHLPATPADPLASPFAARSPRLSSTCTATAPARTPGETTGASCTGCAKSWATASCPKKWWRPPCSRRPAPRCSC